MTTIWHYTALTLARFRARGVVLAGLVVMVGVVFAGGNGTAQQFDPIHPPLGVEGIYDPDNPAISYLQQPSEALSGLPRSAVGNHVDWVKALNEGLIAPRMGLDPRERLRGVDMDVQMNETGSMPFVTFPHYVHTIHLACSNCHTKIFLPKRNANPVNMYEILNGRFCGVCHGKVAFPLTDCFRCHNTKRDNRTLPRFN